MHALDKYWGLGLRSCNSNGIRLFCCITRYRRGGSTRLCILRKKRGGFVWELFFFLYMYCVSAYPCVQYFWEGIFPLRVFSLNLCAGKEYLSLLPVSKEVKTNRYFSHKNDVFVFFFCLYFGGALRCYAGVYNERDVTAMGTARATSGMIIFFIFCGEPIRWSTEFFENGGVSFGCFTP